MGLIELPEDLWLHIIKFLSTNTETCALVKTCRTMRDMGNVCGYLKKLSIRGDCEVYNKHKETINNLQVCAVDVMLTIPWVEKMSFTNCGYPELFTPEHTVNCKRLVYRTFDQGTFHIDWNMFPDLETVVMAVHNLGNMDFSPLTNLKTLYIRVNNGEFRKNPKDTSVKFVSFVDPTGGGVEPDIPLAAIMAACRGH